MNISIIIGAFYPSTYYGGPIISNYCLAKALAKIGHQINVSTTNANGHNHLDVITNTYHEISTNLNVIYYGKANIAGFSIPYILGLYKDVRQADIVYIQPVFSPYVPFALLSAIYYKKNILISPRGSFSNIAISDKRPFIKQLWLSLFIKPWKNNITWHATSQQEREDIVRVFSDAKVAIIPNGVDISECNKVMKMTPLEFSKKYARIELSYDHAIVSIGRLHAIKGFDILIDSFELLLEKHPQSVLFIAGPDGGEKLNLEKQIHDKRLLNKVILVGEISGQDKINFLGNASLFALASHSENFGNVYAESLATGTPIVASNKTPWQIIENHNCGKWVNNSPSDFAQAMDELLCCDLSTLKINARKLANENFDWNGVANQFDALFCKILNK